MDKTAWKTATLVFFLIISCIILPFLLLTDQTAFTVKPSDKQLFVSFLLNVKHLSRETAALYVSGWM